MYKEFIDDQLLPELLKLREKYSVWWSFKPDSSLYKYLQEHNYSVNEHFTPEDLLTIINEIVDTNYLMDAGNSSLVILDQHLQHVFGTEILYKPDIVKFLLPHINLVPFGKSLKLRNQCIYHQLYVKPAADIIYNDVSSMFWLHPDINAHLTKYHQIIFSWSHLVQLFTDFVTNTDHFTHFNESIVSINSTSPLAKLFRTKYFHISQCKDILKLVTKFLGRTNRLNNICPHLNFQISKNDSIFTFIDTVVNNNHSISPSFSSYIYI